VDERLALDRQRARLDPGAAALDDERPALDGEGGSLDPLRLGEDPGDERRSAARSVRPR
jgi:hypothetical protein